MHTHTQTYTVRMEAVMVRSLLASFKKFTNSMTETLQKAIWESERQKSMDHNTAVLRAYKAEQEKMRKRREARNMEKNAERAAMRAHFRRKYHLPTNNEDSRHVQATVRDVFIPCRLSTIVQPKKPKKENSGLLSVHQYRL